MFVSRLPKRSPVKRHFASRTYGRKIRIPNVEVYRKRKNLGR